MINQLASLGRISVALATSCALVAGATAAQHTAFQEAELTDPALTDDAALGWSVDVDGTWAIAGAPLAGPTAVGRAFVFERTSFGWGSAQELQPSEPEALSFFGHSVAVFGDTLAVGAPREAPGGAVYVFVFNGATWVEQQKVVGNDTTTNDDFGFAVDLTLDRLIVGAPDEDAIGHGSGSAYVFVRAAGVWTQEAKLTGSNMEADDEAGYSVAIESDTLVFGAKGQLAETGAAYVFTRSGALWTEQAQLLGSTSQAGDRFGQTVGLAGDSVVVGAPYAVTAMVRSGAVYVFERAGSLWAETNRVTGESPANFDYFGSGVALDGNWLLVGAREHDSLGLDSGSAYLYRSSAGIFGPPLTVASDTTRGGHHFGHAVALHDGVALVGVPLADESAQGLAFAFRTGDSIGTRYCDPAPANSSGLPGRMTVLGDARVAANDLTLIATDLPLTTNVGYFLMGGGTTTFVPNGSAGPICIVPNVQRFLPPAELTSELGAGFVRPIGTTGPISAMILVGSTWNFQAWHRDGMGLSNFTDAVSVTFE